MRIKIQWNSLFPLSMPYVTTLRYQEIFWQNGSLLYGSDTAKQEFFMRLQLRLQSLHKHDFISNQLFFYCWLTQQHFNFSVSVSFKRWYVWQSPRPGGKRFPDEGTNERETPFTTSFWGNFGLNNEQLDFVIRIWVYVLVCMTKCVHKGHKNMF